MARAQTIQQHFDPAPEAGDSSAWWAGLLLVVDQDAGVVLPDGGRAGGLFVLERQGSSPSYSLGELAATDFRWIDPTDALELPDGSWLVLESKWAPTGAETRGAIFRVRLPDPRTAGRDPLRPAPADIELWWTDPRTRQPVGMTRDSEGTLFVSDRDADPDRVLVGEPGRQRTGCVFGIEIGADNRPARTEVVAAGLEFFTPGAILAAGPLLLLMDADANPRGLLATDGRPATPGVLFDLVRAPGSDRLARRRADVLVESDVTTSPVALIERRCGGSKPFTWHRPGAPDVAEPAEWAGLESNEPLPKWLPEIYLVDANFGTSEGATHYDGALFWVQLAAGQPLRPLAHGLAAHLVMQLHARPPGTPRLIDPAYGCALPDGRIAFADANADPEKLGPDGTSKGVFGTGHGAIFAWDPEHPDRLDVLAAWASFVTPVAVRVVSR